ncbi:MAG TPA: DUF6282 family protein [Candidatus Cybelea sp.]|nr:DUF6282 family protein [Candidatus Cybelea sp.]
MVKPLPRIDGQGILDMHVHVGPEFLMRRYSPAALAEEARRQGFGVVMKNHFQPTTAWVAMVRRPDDKVPLIGSVALNLSVGGIDEHGVRGALSGWKRDVGSVDPDPERFVVWMPTLCAEAHLHVMGRRDIPLDWGVAERYTRFFAANTGLQLRDGHGTVISGLARALKTIADHDLVLASGHLGKEDTILLARLARTAGIKRLVLTHPLFQSTRLDSETLHMLWTEYGAYSELAFVNLAMDHLTIPQYVEVIRAVGPEGCILSSDLGQPFSPTVTEGMQQYFHDLEQGGIHPDDIARMAIVNPRRLLF